MKPVLLLFLLAEVVIGDLWDVYLKNNVIVAKQLYEKRITTPGDNFLFSPASTQAISAIVALSGEGETQNQLIKATHSTLNTSEIAEIYTNLNKKLSSGLSNAFIVHDGNVTLNSGYKTFLQKVFNAFIGKLPNRTPSVADSFLVLSNGVKFQHQLTLDVTWKTKFNVVQSATFHVTKKNAQTTDLLHVKEKFNYHSNEVLKAEFLEIPIIDNELTLTIVLPNHGNNLANLEKYISDVLSAQPYEKLNVSVVIPKTWHTDLQILDMSLRLLGVNAPFYQDAQFTPISDAHSQIISGLQRTSIFISKAISEDKQPSGSSVTPVQSVRNFVADHPFIYYIKHSVMGLVVMGRYVSPL